MGAETRLSVNVDHVATVRQARRAAEPDPVTAALLCELAGAHGITCHIRHDETSELIIQPDPSTDPTHLHLTAGIVGPQITFDIAHPHRTKAAIQFVPIFVNSITSSALFKVMSVPPLHLMLPVLFTVIV